MAKIPPEKKEEDYQKFLKFAAGEITWAEIKGYPKSLLKFLAKTAYFHFQKGNYALAESLFKGLSIVDHTNWYYRAALGAIYQKQKLFEEAIDEYTTALDLQEGEVTALANRGECHLQLQNYSEALEDFKQVLSLDSQLKSPWSKRAKVLMDQLIRDGHGEGLK